MQPINEIREVPVLALKPECMVLYNESIRNRKGGNKSKNSLDNLKEDKYKGEVSTNARKRILHTVNWFLLKVGYQVKWRLRKKQPVNRAMSFVTLTLPSKQVHTDNEIKKEVLNQFLVEIRKVWRVKDYFWKAELQQNGNIHFHLLVDKYIPKDDIRVRWVRCLNKLGYIAAYQAKHGHKIPPCTEIRGLRYAKNAAAYIAKYVAKKVENNEPETTKEPNERKLQGRVWHCSESLQNIENVSVNVDVQLQSVLNELEEKGMCKVLRLEHAVVYVWSVYKKGLFGLKDVEELVRNKICEVVGFSRLALN